MRTYRLNENSFQGILQYEKGLYDIIPSKENINNNRLPNIIDNNSSSFSCTTNATNSYYIFSFKNREKVQITKYQFRTNSLGAAYFPVSWVLSGYKNGNWVNISTVHDSNLTKAGQTGTFSVDVIDIFTKIKITQIGETFIGAYHFCIGDFELFGNIGNDFRCVSINCKNRMKNVYQLLIFLICVVNKKIDKTY